MAPCREIRSEVVEVMAEEVLIELEAGTKLMARETNIIRINMEAIDPMITIEIINREVTIKKEMKNIELEDKVKEMKNIGREEMTETITNQEDQTTEMIIEMNIEKEEEVIEENKGILENQNKETEIQGSFF